MHNSMTPARDSSGRSAFSVSASAEASRHWRTECGPEVINRSEVPVSGHQNLNAVALLLPHRRGDVDRVLEHLGQHVLSRRRIDHHGAVVAAAGLHGSLHHTVDNRYEHRGAKALPEVMIRGPGKARSTEFIGTR